MGQPKKPRLPLSPIFRKSRVLDGYKSIPEGAKHMCISTEIILNGGKTIDKISVLIPCYNESVTVAKGGTSHV